MKNALILTILISFSLTNSSPGQDNGTEYKFNQNQLLEDYGFMLKTLEETHPNLYAYIPENEFVEKTDILRKSIDRPLTESEFFKILYKTVSLIKQGHTMVFGDPGFRDFLEEGGLSFPFTIKYADGQIFIDENHSASKTPVKGSELIAINRIPVSQIIDDITPYLRVRPNGFIGSTLEFNWARCLWLEYGFDRNFAISYILPNGDTIRSCTVAGVNNEPKKSKNPDKGKFNFNIDQNRSTAVITLNSFEFDYEEYDSLLYTSFRSIKENNTENLIIDIRDNKGGNGNLVGMLVDYLTDRPYIATSSSLVKTSEATRECYTTHPVFVNAIEQARKAENESEEFLQLTDCFLEKPAGTITTLPADEVIPSYNENRFKGNLYILTSHNTFSGATAFAVIIKDNKIGYIVGEETSDNPTDYGCIMLFQLPNTGITIQNSTLYSVRPAGYDDFHGVIPDFKVKSTYSEFPGEKDKVMNYTYWLIDEGIIDNKKDIVYK